MLEFPKVSYVSFQASKINIKYQFSHTSVIRDHILTLCHKRIKEIVQQIQKIRKTRPPSVDRSIGKHTVTTRKMIFV
jgi:hypothetical protein